MTVRGKAGAAWRARDAITLTASGGSSAQGGSCSD